VRQAGENEGGDDFSGEHEQVTGTEDQVADPSEYACLANLTQVHAGDADERERRHDRLGRAAHHPIGGCDGMDVHGRVLNLDGDEDQAGQRGADAGGPGEAGSGNGHDCAPCPG
jgi:hypothetical protein